MLEAWWMPAGANLNNWFKHSLNIAPTLMEKMLDKCWPNAGSIQIGL